MYPKNGQLGYGLARGDAARGRRDRRDNRGGARTAGRTAEPWRKRAGTKKSMRSTSSSGGRSRVNLIRGAEAFLGGQARTTRRTIYTHGFLCLRCTECAHETLVAFSYPPRFLHDSCYLSIMETKRPCHARSSSASRSERRRRRAHREHRGAGPSGEDARLRDRRHDVAEARRDRGGTVLGKGRLEELAAITGGRASSDRWQSAEVEGPRTL